MTIQVTPIPRLTVLAAPAFTLGLANTAGTAITVVSTNTYGASAATGSAVVASRRDHIHGMPASPVLVSNIVAGTRSAAAGAGDQTITGFGFDPTTVHMMIQKGTATVNGSYGWGDDDADEYTFAVIDTASNFTANSAYIASMNPGVGADAMYAVFKEYTDDGLIITWTAPGSGIDISFAILGMR